MLIGIRTPGAGSVAGRFDSAPMVGDVVTGQSGKRQAGTGVSPAMIAAGVAALEEFSGSYADEQLVQAIYTAMRDAASRAETRPD